MSFNRMFIACPLSMREFDNCEIRHNPGFEK